MLPMKILSLPFSQLGFAGIPTHIHMLESLHAAERSCARIEVDVRFASEVVIE